MTDAQIYEHGNRMRSTWSLEEQTRPFKNNQKCPDVFVTELGREPVVREKLCAEPSIHGGKKSRCDLEAEARKFGWNSV